MNQLKEFIKKIQTERRIAFLNEEATKQSIILPILQILGWQVFDPDEVSPEYSIQNIRVDYALRQGQHTKVFLEAKKASEDLEKHQEQLLNYSFHQGVSLAILTNGISWWFYLPLQEGNWEQRKFYAVDMYSQDLDQIADAFNKFLDRKKVFNGDALKNAKEVSNYRKKRDILRNSIPKAWRKLHDEGTQQLIELIADTTEKICGYRPEDSQVKDFLYSVGNTEHRMPRNIKIEKKPVANTKKVEPKRVEPVIIPSQDSKIYSLHNSFKGKKIIGFNFLNKNISATSWKGLLVRFIEEINSIHYGEFEKITKIKGRKKAYFSKNIEDLLRPQRIANSDFYAETNFSANSIIKIIKEILSLFNYSENDLKIKILSE